MFKNLSFLLSIKAGFVEFAGKCFVVQMKDNLHYSTWRRGVHDMKNQLMLGIGRGSSKDFSSVFHTCLFLRICMVPVWSCKFHVSNIVNKFISLSFQNVFCV